MNFNIIETTRNILSEFPKIKDVVNSVSIDFSDDTKEDYGLSPIGDTLLNEDILGNQTRLHNFVLYATYQSHNDFDRLSNSGILLELSMWLGDIANHQPITQIVDDVEYNGTIESISASNGMLYEIPNDNFQELCRYQLQIAVTYKIIKE